MSNINTGGAALGALSASRSAKPKLIYGVGANDADYVVSPTINGKRLWCPYYAAWRNMLARCYSPAYQKRNPTYIGCSVSPEWRSFSAFRAWMIEQDWQGEHLDKDILIPGNKVYGPDTCVFVSGSVNTLLNDCAAARGKFPLGVCWDKQWGKFRARVGINGKQKNIGLFNTAAEAHAAWQTAKARAILTAIAEQTDPRVVAALLLRVEQLHADHAAGRETVTLNGVPAEPERRAA